MSKAARATTMLERAGVAFSVASYDYDPGADKIGLQAAEALGEPESARRPSLVIAAAARARRSLASAPRLVLRSRAGPGCPSLSG